MSNLRVRDIIMDVDVEPLNSQTYRREQAAQEQIPLPSFDQPIATSSPPLDDKTEGKTTIKRRRSDRTSWPGSRPSTPGPNIIRRRSSAAREAMDFQYGHQFDMGLGSSVQASLSGSPAQSSRGSEQPGTDVPVKYTPVTGRISRAKKGVPVHTCDICRPTKKFTRAEHLRRHQLSHQKPAYPCTFKDCERAFYRPDLLARHLNLHETQCEKPYKSSESRSRRGSSSASESRIPSLKVETPSQRPSQTQTSPSESATPRTSGGAEGSTTSFSGNFSATNFFHESGSTHKRSVSEAQLSGAGHYSPASPSSSQTARPPTTFISSLYVSNHGTSLADEDAFGQNRARFGGVYFEGSSPTFPAFGGSSHSLPLLQIPQETYVPGSFGYYTESVGSPAALPAYDEPMAQIFPASPTRTSDPGLAGIDRGKNMESYSLGSMGDLTVSSQASYQQLPQLDGYIARYFQFFDTLFPIIHRGTFNASEDSLLSSAMAAIGTQYHDTPEARQKGVELNEYCRKSIVLCVNWNHNTMSAILLTEIFTRFRARKTNVEVSPNFKELYTRLLTNSSRDQTPFSTHSSNIATNETLLDPFNPHHATQNLQNSNTHFDWVQWARNEGRQRLLAACFMFDIHRSIYHEQRRSEVNVDEVAFMLCLPCPDNLWNASTADEWKSQSADRSLLQLPLMEDLSSHYVASGCSPFAQCLLICLLAAQLPVRDNLTYHNYFLPNSMDSATKSLKSLFPTSPLAHSYLALNYTPLNDLLAISGDTWVFGKKVTSPEAFQSAGKRLYQWSKSPAAAAATQYACQVIATILKPQSPELTCVSDYWALHSSALICWAFGHRKSLSAASGSSSRVNSSTLTSDSSMDVDSPPISSPDETKVKALKYINGMLELGTEDLLTNKASMRGETDGVIDAVRSRLELEGVGNKCMMIVDAVMVLTRIKEGGRGKWF